MKLGRRKLLILLVCAAMAAGVVALWPKGREPEYNGKKLSEWLRDYRPVHQRMVPVASEEAADAVRHIGTNGLPILVKWIQETKEPPKWKEKMLELFDRISPKSTDRLFEVFAGRELRDWRAVWGFEILGEEARSAIPDLVRVANSGNKEAASSAIRALGYLGKDALPPLLGLASKNEFKGHDASLTVIGQMGYLGTNAHPAVLFFVKNINDRENEVAAADVLGRLHLESDISVPALAECLESTNGIVRMWGAISLGRFGVDAQAALPALRKALKDPYVSVRNQATNALRLIAPEVLGKEGGQ